MINRLRVILPPDSVVIGVVLAFALLEAPFVLLEWNMQMPIDSPRPALYVLRLMAFIYGSWRLLAFHPASQPDYRVWLERSPWNYQKALPAGPITLVWEDALPLGGLAVMAAFLGPIVPYQAISLFLLGYLVSLASSFFRTDPRGFGYALLFAIGLAIRFWPDPRLMLTIVVIVYGIGLIGLRIALMRFPWAFFQDIDGHRTANKADELSKYSEDSCGWPFDQLKPPPKPTWKMSKLDGLMIGLLSGWYLFAAESLWPARNDQLFLVQKGFTLAVGILASVRTVLYCGGHASPISLLGRIRTFRWIIPGYDRVFLAPLCTILVGVLAIDRFRPPGLDDLIVLPMALALAVVVALDTGPSLQNWRLTGQHRITASAAKMGGDFVKVG